MNMDVDYMVHKSRIQEHLQEAAQTTLRNQQWENKTEKTGKNKVDALVALVVKMVPVSPIAEGATALTHRYMTASYAAIHHVTKQIQGPNLMANVRKDKK